MAKSPTRSRQRQGTAWYWKQTDCWYYTPPGTKRRAALFDERGQRIRGRGNRQAAALALARVRLATDWKPEPESAATGPDHATPWLVATICSEYIEHCRRRAAIGAMAADYRDEVIRYLNALCEFCGVLAVAELKKSHVQFWIESHPTWRSPATRRNAIGIVLAAFNHGRSEHGVQHALGGLKKPPAQPKLFSFSVEDEQQLYAATDLEFRDFLFAAIHTGLRPFCELARLTADDVEQTPRGMMWRVYSSKTKKIRKIPVRPEVATVARKLMKTAPQRSGLPLFRNPLGRPWKKVTGVSRFLKIKRELGWDQDPARRRYSSYICRHTFAHRMLSGFWNRGAGCSIETLAELMGDTPKVAFDHYGKEWGQHYQEPLWAAMRRLGAENPDGQARR